MTQNSAIRANSMWSARPSATWATCPRALRGVCHRRCHLLRRHACDVKAADAPGISKPLVRCDENVIASRAAGLVDCLLAGETLAFASDAGMPSVSDPGQALVEAAREPMCPSKLFPGPLLASRRSFRPAFSASIFSSRAFWAESTATVCAVCSALRGARRTHLLRVSTSHRGDARGRGGGLSPA